MKQSRRAAVDVPRTLAYYPVRDAAGVSCGSNSVVECHLAKVDVEGSNPFSRSSVEIMHYSVSCGWQ